MLCVLCVQGCQVLEDGIQRVWIKGKIQMHGQVHEEEKQQEQDK